MNTSTEPRITAVITTYRRDWQYIERAIFSILKQTLQPKEIFLVDDNTPGDEWSDAIRRKLKAFPDVQYLTQCRSCGVASARNYAIFRSHSDYIAFLDDNDEWLPDKLEKQADILERHPNTALVFGMGIQAGNVSESKKCPWPGTAFKSGPSFADMLEDNYVGSASHPLFNVHIARMLGGFCTSRKQPALEDYEFWLRIVKSYRIWGTRDTLYRQYLPEDKPSRSENLRTFRGYVNIYRKYRTDYRMYPKARAGILRSIVRSGAAAKTLLVIPYYFMWLSNGISSAKTVLH